MDPGTGKTYIALLIVLMLRQRALYICHRESIQNQTMEVFRGRGLRVSKRVEDASNSEIDAVVLIVNTAAKCDPGVFSHFGTSIYDEVHHYCSPEFAKVLGKSRATYNLCMSASTDERPDGLDIMYHVHHGPTVTGRDLGIEGKIYHFDIEFTIIRHNWGAAYNYVERGASNMRSYWGGVKALNKCPERRALLMHHLGALLERGHSVYIMAHETETVQTIAKLVEIAHAGSSMCRLTSRTSEEIKMAYKTDNEIVIATYKYVIEGISIPHMTAVIWWDPPLPSNVKQALGRILRPGPEQHKKREVIDVVDEGSMFERWYDKGNENHGSRESHYKKLLAR
jgi:superfamily II DNA or RNA helicase